ncbi:MAG: hypothetical protein K9I94_15120 [Bacteroidales bacterium]|nr:hypothetical protein [Bacteroidales bacterium]
MRLRICYVHIKKAFFIAVLFTVLIPLCAGEGSIKNREHFREELKQRTFNFFWEQMDEQTYQIPDRYPTKTFTSIAATGYGLTSYIVGIENGYISREEGSQRVLNTLRWLADSKQGPQKSGTTGYKGFYYHFLTYKNGKRFKDTELSTIDTGLLMAGILSCQSYFEGQSKVEREIRKLADFLYRRVQWDWAMNDEKWMSMGWRPERGFIKAQWKGYNEAMILIIMALGSPTHPIYKKAWDAWCESYQWDTFYSFPHINFSPLFGHQYSHMYIDFRGIQDQFMKEKEIDYFENSKRATLSNRAYCIDNPKDFKGYGPHIWGLTACDGPSHKKYLYRGDTIQFFTYRARGASTRHIIDDGTIAPTAAGGSIPFAPDKCLNALYAMYKTYGDDLFNKYGFKDSFNPTYAKVAMNDQQVWINKDYLGIDQGPILIQLENYESGLIWNIMKKNAYIINGLKRAGFKGGWLNEINHEDK